MRTSFRLLLGAAFGILLVACAVSEEAYMTQSTPPPIQVKIDPEQARLAQEVIRLANAERAARGLQPLREQPPLQHAAMWMANDLAAHESFTHTDSKGREAGERIRAFGYDDVRMIAENLGKGAESPEAVVRGWLNSSGHRQNLLHPDLREVGVGYAAKDRERYWVLDLGTRFSPSP